MSATGAADLLAARLTRVQAEGRIPSVVAGVVRDGALAATAAVHGDVDRSYRIGSITKTLTAVLVWQLVEEGRAGIDEPVGRWVPETGYADRPLADLLGHTGGLQSEPVGPWWERSPGTDFAAVVAANDGSGAVHPGGGPGAWHHYSNLSYALLGEVVARERGASWWDCVRTRLLEPLGMGRTTYLPDERSVQGHSVVHFTGVVEDEPATDTGAMAPAGQLWSTVGDLVVWLRFLADGHPDVLTPATLALMAAERPGSTYGAGLHRVVAGGRVLVGHTGSMPGFQASAFVDRERRDGAVVLAASTTGLPADRMPELLLAEPAEGEDAVPVEAPWVPTRSLPPEVQGLPGLWFWGNTAYELRWNQGRLELRGLQSGALSEQFEVREGRIVGVQGYHRGETLHVVRRGDGGVDHLECATFVYTATPYAAVRARG